MIQHWFSMKTFYGLIHPQNSNGHNHNNKIILKNGSAKDTT